MTATAVVTACSAATTSNGDALTLLLTVAGVAVGMLLFRAFL